MRLRTVERTLNPEPFDPGQPVRVNGCRGSVWSLGPEHGRNRDSRWVVCEDGIVRLLMLSKGKDGALTEAGWLRGMEYVPSTPVRVKPENSREISPKTIDGQTKTRLMSTSERRTQSPPPNRRRITEMATVKTPTAADVRAWARGKGLIVADSDRGRLSAEVIAAYNKGRKHTYAPTMVQASAVKVMDIPGYKIGKNGRKTRVTFHNVPVSEVRAWAQANGYEVGARGRIPAEVIAAFGVRDLPAAE